MVLLVLETRDMTEIGYRIITETHEGASVVTVEDVHARNLTVGVDVGRILRMFLFVDFHDAVAINERR